MSGEEPGKQKTRSCRTQELARSSAQENERQKNARTGLSGNRGTGGCRDPSQSGEGSRVACLLKALLGVTLEAGRMPTIVASYPSQVRLLLRQANYTSR